METTAQRNFVRTILPWIVAAVMLLIYLVTLDRVVTAQSVFPLARASGMDWQPIYISPLYWLVTLPIRWLPSGLQLMGMNFLGALCAALSLALLARSVALLPHDRTQLQRDKLSDEDSFLRIRLAWVPVIFAVLVCGLQRTFWEQAIIFTGEMLDLLLFAYCVRCLLEFRLDERNSWLSKMAFVYGLGITNNFAMIAFFPVALTALIWIKGMRFFRFDFIARMFLLGLAGLSLYLLLPIVQMNSEATFWQALKANLTFQKFYVFNYLPRWKLLWIAPYALLPLLLAGIRWPSSFGDTSPVGSAFTNIFGIILHAGLLSFCLYMAFDPSKAGLREFAPGLVLLPCYYLAALSIGYLSGFLLLIFHETNTKSRRGFPVPRIVNYAVTALVCAGAIFVAGRLAAQNITRVREITSPGLHDYASELVRSLPDKPSVVLSDDPVRLSAVSALLPRGVGSHILLETASLTNRAYQKLLAKRYGDRWPKLTLEPGLVDFTPEQTVQQLLTLGQKHDLFYLHPSFGLYFETFYLQPRKLVYQLKLLPPDVTEVPLPSAELINEQAAAWNAVATGALKNLKADIATLPDDPMQRAMSGSIYVGTLYSRGLNWWGVELQRAGRFDEAAKFFEEAVAINEDNAAALVNREVNASWRQGRQRVAQLSKETMEKLGLYQGLPPLLNSCGPVDQADFAMEVAQFLVQGGLYRQAGQLVRRALYYAPEEVVYQIALANLALLAKQPEGALSQLSAVRSRTTNLTPTVQFELARIEATARYSLGDFPAAEKLLERLVTRFPDQDQGYNMLSQLHVTYSEKLRSETNIAAANLQLTNGLKVIERQIKAQPQNPDAFFNYGNFLIYLNDHPRAVTAFTRVLELQKDHSAALLNRAIAYLVTKKYDEAKRDYQELLSRYTTTNFRVYFGLGEVAYQQQEWKSARDYYQQYLRYAPANSAETQTIRTRLEEVKKKT